MPMTILPPIDYSKTDYHYSFSIGTHDFCVCDRCDGLFKHIRYGGCGSLKKLDGKWLCINCKEAKK